MNNLYPLFWENIQTNHLIQQNDTIILGFSGGKDSVTLFYLLRELKKSIDFHFVAAYFNHKLRSDASTEQEWVEQFCRFHDVEFITGTRDIIEFKETNKLNLEHAASLSRYRFFKQISAHYPNAKIATAHTKSDLTETFFIKLFRGSGLQGLSTIFHKKENIIIRPLLLFHQEEILEFLQRNKIEYYEDYTNKGDAFLRNRIRHHIVPAIKEIEPEIHKRIYRTVSIIQDEYDYFSETAKTILDKNLILGKILPGSILKEFHPALQRHIVREYIRLMKGNLLDIDFDHIESVRTRNTTQRGLSVPGIEFVFHKGYIFPSGTTIPGYCYTVASPGTFSISEIKKTIRISQTETFRKLNHHEGIVIPFEKVQFPLTVRNPLPTDKYIKINSVLNQKVIEMIRASGIPSEMRNLCPVVVNRDGQIIWCAGSPVADAFKDNRNIHSSRQEPVESPAGYLSILIDRR